MAQYMGILQTPFISPWIDLEFFSSAHLLLLNVVSTVDV